MYNGRPKEPMTLRRALLAFAVTFALTLHGPIRAQTAAQQTPAEPAADALALRLPPDWRQPVATVLTISETQRDDLLKLADDALRQSLARMLLRTAKADDFLKAQLTIDRSPRVRTVIVQAMADARWASSAETVPLLETIAASDPDVGVSLAALESLRRTRMRRLSAILAERLAAAKTARDAETMARLIDEQERWISLERAAMLPTFLRTAPPPFSVLPADRTIRVLAFGDFGNGSADQKNLAQTIARYHRDRPLDFAITLGDNFYSRGMESPSDPRWQTWWEDLYGPLGITFYAALGNHDWGFPDSPAAEILYSRDSKSWRMPASYYTFTAGAVQFFALDTQSVALSEKQLAWLDRELSQSRAPWKIVYGHHPIYSGGNYEERPDLIAQLLPVLRSRADAYICGHDHNLQVLRPESGVRFYVAGAGGAGLYDLRPYERTIFASRTNGFAVLEADAARLTVRLIDSAGQQIYEDVVSKPATASSGR
jgi:hypothetical protein